MKSIRLLTFLTCLVSSISLHSQDSILCGNCMTYGTTYTKMSTKPLKKAWRKFLSALKTGETLKVQAMCTESGFEILSSLVSPTNGENPLRLTFKSWGNTWSKSKVNYNVQFKTTQYYRHSTSCPTSQTVELLNDKGEIIGEFHFWWTEKGLVFINWVIL